MMASDSPPAVVTPPLEVDAGVTPGPGPSWAPLAATSMLLAVPPLPRRRRRSVEDARALSPLTPIRAPK